MEEQNNLIEQLKTMQSNIVSLFQGVIKERNDYKEGNNFLAAGLKQMIDRVENLERQNEALRKCNTSLRSIFGVGVKTFRKLDLSCANSIKDNKVSLELLQKLFLESSEKIEVKCDVSSKTQFSSPGEEKNPDIKVEVSNDQIKVKKYSFDNSNGPTAIRDENEAGRNEIGTQLKLNNPEEILRNIIGKKGESENEWRRRLISQSDASTSEQVDTAPCKPAVLSARTNGTVNGSPVFKDSRKQDATRAEDNKSLKPSCLKLINEKFVEKSVQLLISPPKPQQADWSSTNKGQFTPKRGKNDSKFSSANRSPGTPLRNSNSREADTATSAGGKKLMQTKLNIDCFKQKSPAAAKISESGDDGRINKRSRMVNADDDDIILDSPKREVPLLENIKREEKTEADSRYLDETFISSPIVRKFNAEQHNLVEKIVKNESTCKRPREKSPEYDSVPFVYKREAVRKKEERMKLPGHPCAECDKYYKNALGDIDRKDLERILNKCSRHRDKNPPELDDTPPGYWKPYLTCSTIFSPNKDDAR